MRQMFDELVKQEVPQINELDLTYGEPILLMDSPSIQLWNSKETTI